MSLILIADDNPHAHRMGRQILSQEGHEVVTVSSGDEALKYLEHNRPDLVMVDTRMPGPNGYEVCREVKHGGRFTDVGVVLLAGPLEPFDSNMAQTAGCDAVLHKPLDAYSLIETINKLLGEVASHAAADPPDPEVMNGSGAESSHSARQAVAADPFEDLVEQALGRNDAKASRDANVRAAVTEAVEATLPDLVDTITKHVVAKLNGPG